MTDVGPVVLRPARPGDAADLLLLRLGLLESLGRDVGPASAPWRHDALRWFAHRAEDPRWRILGAAAPTGLVAYGAATVTEHLPGPGRPDGRKAYVVSMATAPAWRRRGLARAILLDLVRWARGQGLDVVDLHATADGYPLYRSVGFEPSPFTAMTLRLDQEGC
jgi:GNAT superfamily N-acetyltransferase